MSLIVSWGELLWDRFPDETRLGGAPANVAHHLRQLGSSAALITRLGDDDLGKQALARLTAANIDASAVQIDPRRPTGEVGVTLDAAGEPHYTMTPGCAWEYIECTAAAAALLSRAGAFCFGTFSQRQPEGLASLREAATHLPADCLRVCDANFRPKGVMREALAFAIELCDVIKINRLERDGIAEHFGLADPIRWLLHDKQVELVALTKGAEGCTLYRQSETRECSAPVVFTSGDRVGAGDAFTASLTIDLLAGVSLAEIGARANRVAGFVASVPGATPTLPIGFRS